MESSVNKQIRVNGMLFLHRVWGTKTLVVIIVIIMRVTWLLHPVFRCMSYGEFTLSENGSNNFLWCSLIFSLIFFAFASSFTRCELAISVVTFPWGALTFQRHRECAMDDDVEKRNVFSTTCCAFNVVSFLVPARHASVPARWEIRQQESGNT